MKSLPDLTWLKRGSQVPVKADSNDSTPTTLRCSGQSEKRDEIDILIGSGGKRSGHGD